MATSVLERLPRLVRGGGKEVRWGKDGSHLAGGS